MYSTNPFRLKHLFSLLDFYQEQELPLDLVISRYFKLRKSLGSKDRAFIAEAIYGMMRWMTLIDFFCEENASWEKKWEVYQTLDISKLTKDVSIPEHIRFGFPKELYDLILKSHGAEKGQQLCLASNAPAPTTIRVNLLKTNRETLLSKWSEKFQISECSKSSTGIIFHKKINFFELEEFKQGLFEVQDEGSQLIAELMSIKPGQHILDYCSGSGGKTLAFAPKTEKKGQIFLHDIRPTILLEAKKRLRRAGVQNAQIVHPEDEQKLKKLKRQMDWILADVPCSGTGTLRRNPDMKWKITDEMVARLLGQQRTIFEKALSFMKPEGHIVYATCSILNEENQQQIDHFVKTYDLEVVGDIFQSLPQFGKMDGFFAAILQRREKAP